MKQYNKTIFPDAEEFIHFYGYISKAVNNQRFKAKHIYLKFISEFNFVEDAFCSDLIKLKKTDTIIIFLYFMTNIEVNISVENLRINNPKAILNYFGIVDERFWAACDEMKIKNLDNKCSQILKTLIYLGKREFDAITFKDLTNMYATSFYYAVKRSYSIPTTIQNIKERISKKAMPTSITKFSNRKYNYSEIEKNAKSIISEYLKKEYTNKGYQISSPLYSIRSFLQWINYVHKSIKYLNNINLVHWIEYKDYVNNLKLKERTKQVRIDLVSKFLQWIQENNIINEKIVEYGERYRRVEECKPRMLYTREHFKLIVKAIIDFNPQNEYDSLVQNYLKVVTATGLRLTEAKWLEIGCIRTIEDNVGEITLTVKDKTGIINKTTSIMPWGIESINLLEDRYAKINGMEIYNSRTGRYVKSLFQYNGKLISNDKIYKILNNIMESLEFGDEYGNLIDYRDIKLHSFRHQKFNDIFDVSDGNIIAVKMDSNHISTTMARRYTKQGERKKNLEIIKAIEEGYIVGKGAELLKALINIEIPHDKYIETVKKMNTTATINIKNNKNISRYLGFGFCTGDCKKIKKFCESCDYFYTCSDFEEQLKDRYAKNFAIIKSRTIVDEDNVYILKQDKKLIESLKYQEKWLLELGVKKEEINSLKIKYLD